MKHTNWNKQKKGYISPFDEFDEFVLFDSKRFVKEIEPYVLKIEKEHKEMYEAIKQYMRSPFQSHSQGQAINEFNSLLKEIEL